jgi:hypothetical protein
MAEKVKTPFDKDRTTPMPFDDALRHLLKAPPQHKVAKKKAKKK